MRKFISRICTVPILIFFSVLIVSFRFSDVLNNIYPAWAAVSIAEVHAQSSRVKQGSSGAKTDATMKPIKASMVLNEARRDPTLFSKTDISGLQKLAARRELIDARSEELKLREGLLGAAEKRIDKKILELKRLIIALEKTIKRKRN